MKNAQLITTNFQSQPNLLYRHTFRIFAGLVMMALCISCPPDVPDGGAPEFVSTPLDTVHLAFAGGGWRAHTGHSAWTMALLDGGTKKLDSVFKNVGTISSNSGGSWFSTMLMFSGGFVQAIEAPNAIASWDSTGWLGQQEQLFNSAPCQSDHGYSYLNCVANHLIPGSGKYYWKKVVEDVVFKDYPIDNSVKLSSPRQAWAKDKPLLLAATMLTTEVVLNKTVEDFVTYHRYYEACLEPHNPVMKGDSGATCSGQAIAPDVTPVTFSSIPERTKLQVPPFLPAAELAKINISYTKDWVEDTPPITTATIQNPLANDQVPVVTAAAASSAAAGFTASAVVSGYFDASYIAEDEALGFELSDSQVQFLDISNDYNLDTLAARKIVRIADGGPTDNSGVAHLISFLQLNSKADSFNIVAFDNVQQLYVPNGNGAAVGSDISSLFGLGICPGNKFCADTLCSEFCINLPDVQVFDSTVVNTTSATWRASAGEPGNELIYTKYSVTTVDNPTFGIKSGTTGTLHAFTCAWSNANTEPLNKKNNPDFKAYAEMLDFINSGLLKNKKEGLRHLETALGLSN